MRTVTREDTLDALYEETFAFAKRVESGLDPFSGVRPLPREG
jgi:hypothetical protein